MMQSKNTTERLEKKKLKENFVVAYGKFFSLTLQAARTTLELINNPLQIRINK
jgi:hypothetical protein